MELGIKKLQGTVDGWHRAPVRPPCPQTLRDLRVLLGLAAMERHYIDDYAGLVEEIKTEVDQGQWSAQSAASWHLYWRALYWYL